MTETHGDLVDAREQVSALEAQLRAVTRSAREMVHLLSNELTLAGGDVELLQVHPTLPEELRELVQGAADGLETAAQNVERLHRDLRTASETTPGALRGEPAP
jgi:hypothetical protein